MTKKATDPQTDPMMRLVHYWMTAEVMREHFVDTMEEYEGRMEDLKQEGEDWRFNTYLGFWMAALFVVVEGFNKLKITDSRVTCLFNEHLRDLKSMRHEMFHFQLAAEAKGVDAIERGNWAGELHEALGAHIADYVHEQAKLERAEKRRLRGKKRNAKAKVQRRGHRAAT